MTLARAIPVLVESPGLVAAVLGALGLGLLAGVLARRLREKELLKQYAIQHSNLAESDALRGGAGTTCPSAGNYKHFFMKISM